MPRTHQYIGQCAKGFPSRLHTTTIMSNGTNGTPVDDLLVSQEDILTEGVQDELLLELPPMANGKDIPCAKNWDVSILQNCTMNRMKIIARDYESVGASIRTKPELYRSLHEAMMRETHCETCNDAQCNPQTHQFLPSEDAPEGWIMGINNIYVKMARYNPEATSAAGTPATPTIPIPTAPTQPLRTASPHIPLQPRVDATTS